MPSRAAVTAALALLLSIGASEVLAQAGTAAGPKIVIKSIWSMSQTSLMGFGVAKFKEIVERKSGGRISVEMFPNNSVTGGSSPAAIQLVQANTIQMTQNTPDQLSNLVPDLGVLSLPFMFPTREVAHKLVDGPMGQGLLRRLEAQALVGLDFWELGFRQLSNKRREVLKPEDMKGLRVRVSEGVIKAAAIRAIGAVPVTIPGPEIYMALQTGVVDATEVPENVFASFKFHEVQSYLTKWNYVWDATIELFSKNFMDSQTPEIQRIIKESVKEATALQRQEQGKAEEAAEKLFAAQKLKVTILTPQQLQPFRAAARTIYTTDAPKTISKEVIERWVKATAQ